MNLLESPFTSLAFDEAAFIIAATRGASVVPEKVRLGGTLVTIANKLYFKPTPDPAAVSAAIAAAAAAAAAVVITAEALGTIIDFSTAPIKTKTLTADVTFTTANILAGKVVRARLQSTGGARTITWPAGWVWAGTAPTALAQNKYALLTLAAFGTANADIVATWNVQP